MRMTNPAQNDYDHLLGLAALFEEDFSVDWIMAGRKPSQILNLLQEAIRQGCLGKTEPSLFRFPNP